jgi:hypothetical protein
MKEEDVVQMKQKGFLASCISHATHRFAKGLKKYATFSDREHKIFAGCWFSILANAVDLETVKTIFRLMCETFLRKYDDDKCKSARKFYIIYHLINHLSLLIHDKILFYSFFSVLVDFEIR